MRDNLTEHQRQHIIERLNAGLRRKLTLISAAAGLGKTAFLSWRIHSSAWTAAVEWGPP